MKEIKTKLEFNTPSNTTSCLPLRLLMTALVAAAALILAACSEHNNVLSVSPLPTLNGQLPVVIAHRGASGYLPEETLEAYVLAIEMGADVIEMDLVSTKDGVLIARHDPNLALNTDVASHLEFTNRKITTRVDGETQTGWFCNDFTLSEIKSLGAIQTDPERSQQFNGLYKILTFQEVLDLVKIKRHETGRIIGIYPETKNPTYFRDLGLPLEDKLIAMLDSAGLNSKTEQVFVQSFEPSSLKYMKSRGLKTKLIQLIDGDGINMKTGAMTYAAPFDRPYDWTKAGDTRNFDVMVTPAGLAEIKTYADGIGPWKRYIISIKGTVGTDGALIDLNHDGKINDADGVSSAPTSLISDAHKAGLFVHAYTFRNESRQLAFDYYGDPVKEYIVYYRLGIDGVFTDFTNKAIKARNAFYRYLPISTPEIR